MSIYKNEQCVNSKERTYAFDFLRIIAAFAVVWLHVSAQHWYDTFPSYEWEIMNIYDSLVRWCVPVFVMISGALFLNPSRHLSIRKLYKKNISRIICAFLFWSAIYSLFYIKADTNINGILGFLIEGPFHLWFLKMLMGLYIAVPILRVIVLNKQVEVYFLCVALITAFLIPLFLGGIEHINEQLAGLLQTNYETFGINIASGYAGYFVLGHFLTTYPINDKVKYVIYMIAFVCLLLVIMVTHFYSTRIGQPYGGLYGYLNPFTLFEAMAIFIFVNEHCTRPTARQRHIVTNISNLSFGIYLIHILIMSLFRSYIGIDSSTFNPLFFIPCYSIIVFIVSYWVVRIIHSVAYLNKIIM